VKVVVRLAAQSEIPELQRIEAAGDAQFVAAGHPEFDDTGTVSAVEASEAIDDRRMAVATADVPTATDTSTHPIERALAGFILIAMEGTEMAVVQISVSPNHQRQGVGRRLMEGAFEQAALRGHTQLMLDTQADVAWNAPWYNALGFEVVPRAEWTVAMHTITAEQTAAGFDWTTRVHMRRLL
jgi:GNAT superfamily N-acetyltransferase